MKNEIETRLERDVSLGTMNTAPIRLEDKGGIRSSNGEATEEWAGRPGKYYEIMAVGKKAIAYSKSSRDKLWDAITKVVLQIHGSF